MDIVRSFTEDHFYEIINVLQSLEVDKIIFIVHKQATYTECPKKWCDVVIRIFLDTVYIITGLLSFILILNLDTWIAQWVLPSD